MKKKYSCFLEDQGYFGNYPSQSDIDTMEEIGIHYFINPHEQDNLEKYTCRQILQVNLLFLIEMYYDIFNLHYYFKIS